MLHTCDCLTAMPEILSIVDSMRGAWRALPLGPGIERDTVRALIAGAGMLTVISAIERLYHIRTHYRTRMFAHDLAYWFYYRSGLHALMVYVLILAAIERPLSSLDAFLNLQLLSNIPWVPQIFLFTVINDGIAYWVHRAQHYSRFLWAFHATHHSQEHITFATTHRSHPLEGVIVSTMTYIPMRILGVPVESGIVLFLAKELIAALSHSQIPWGYGPFNRLIVSPRHHAFHHSRDPMHHNKNFGVFFSFWDYLFGTAVNRDSPAPVRFGLENVDNTSLWSTLVTPFRLLRESYAAPAPGQVPGPR